MNVHLIVGRVRDQATGKPIARARVCAYDRDDYVDDLIGEAVTADDGRFEIAGADYDAFADFVEDSPDVVIDVQLANGAIYSSRRDLRWTAGKLLPLAPVDVPGDVLDAPKGSGRARARPWRGRPRSRSRP